MSYNNIEISKMTISDFEEISSSLLNDFDDFWQPSTLKKELQSENSYYIVARYSSEIVGFAGIKTVLDEADIMNIVTKKSKRNLGIGLCLLKNLIYIAKENDIKKLTLEVNYRNTSAIHLYKKFDFKEIAVRKKYYGNVDNAIIMQLDIFQKGGTNEKK